MTAKKKGGSQAEGTRRSYFVFDPDEIIIIGLDTDDGPEHPLYDAESNAFPAEKQAANIANVRALGVLKPILFERDGNRILAVDGRTRTRWAREAKKLQLAAGEEPLVVPGIPKRGDGATLYGVSRAANTGRPADGPLANARQAQRLIDMGRSAADAAVLFGVTSKTLEMWLTLLGLHPKLQRAIEKGLAISAAAPLAKLSREEQVAQLEKLTAGGAKPTARNVTNRLREGQGKAAVVTPAQKLRMITAILAEHAAEGDGNPREALDQVRSIIEGKVTP